MENNNKLFGICGSSGSGKSFIVKYVLENLGSDNISVIYHADIMLYHYIRMRF